MLRLAILASGGGSNLKAILDCRQRGELGEAAPVLVVADRPCRALQRAEEAGVETRLLDRKLPGGGLSARLAELLREFRIDFVALAGWLSILDAEFTAAWEERILNIHPSLLPRHGGRGMYGEKVHKAVIGSGDAESGCTVHIVTEEVDRGRIIERAVVPVRPEETPESLATRVLAQEHILYPRAIRTFAADLIHVLPVADVLGVELERGAQ